MKLLKDLVDCNLEIEIRGVTSRSEKVEEGFLFVATEGFNHNRIEFLEDAINRGAVAVVTSTKVESNIPLILVDNVNEKLYEICEKFYDKVNMDELNITGVTGTDGKTSTTTFLYQLLNFEEKTAYIGSNGLIMGEEVISTGINTPEVDSLYKIFDLIVSKGYKNIVLETSSEGLMHKRVSFVKYSQVGFTNISEDHLNVHKTRENYIAAKLSLIDLVKPTGAIGVNVDDIEISKISDSRKKTYGYNNKADYQISNINENKENTKFTITVDNNEYNIESPFVGMFNVYNLTLAFLLLRERGFDAKKAVENIKLLKPAPGRRELFKFSKDYDIIIDYAHTVNGVSEMLKSVSSKGYNNIITVSGVAGGRQKEKRPHMGKLFLDNSSLVVFTMEDPRFESVDDIIDDMIGDSIKTNYVRINDRKEAIEYALGKASKNDVVLVLGKGREKYQLVKDQKLLHSDYETIKNYFK